MPAPSSRVSILAISAALFAGCGERSVPPPPRSTTTTTAVTRTQNVLPEPDARYKYDAYGPFQWSPFVGVNRDNIYVPATGPTTGPVDDSVLFPVDDTTW